MVDLARLHRETDIPVLVVTRRRPRMELVRAALEKTPGGADKWALIEQAGALERLGAELRWAFEKVGFYYLRGHGIPPALIDATFAEATAYFPAPLVCLRTMKSDSLAGIPDERTAALDAIDLAWRVNGRRGVIQASR